MKTVITSEVPIRIQDPTEAARPSSALRQSRVCTVSGSSKVS